MLTVLGLLAWLACGSWLAWRLFGVCADDAPPPVAPNCWRSTHEATLFGTGRDGT